MKNETNFQVEKKVLVNLIRKIVEEVEEVYSIKTAFFGKDIRIKQDLEGMDISLGVIVKRAASIPQVAQQIQNNLKQELEKTVGTSVRTVAVKVKGIKFPT